METGEPARDASENDTVQLAARLGYVASGILHVVLAFITLSLAWGSSTTSADQSGALAMLADTGVGRVLLWVLVASFAGLGSWQATAAVAGKQGRDAAARGKGAAKTILYAALAWSAFGFARGSGGSSSQRTSDVTASLMSAPGGRLAITVVGVAVLGVGGYHVVKGWQRRFLHDLREHPGAWAVWSGVLGYVTKGVSLGIMGALFLAAAWTASSSKAAGLDGALRTLRDEPQGQWLLTLVAIGIAAYGSYSFARARHARV